VVRASDSATVLGSIAASSDTVESEGRQMKQCWIQYKEEKNLKNPLFKNSTTFYLQVWFCWQSFWMFFFLILLGMLSAESYRKSLTIIDNEKFMGYQHGVWRAADQDLGRQWTFEWEQGDGWHTPLCCYHCLIPELTYFYVKDILAWSPPLTFFSTLLRVRRIYLKWACLSHLVQKVRTINHRLEEN
jgi:hypothetical protein